MENLVGACEMEKDVKVRENEASEYRCVRNVDFR